MGMPPRMASGGLKLACSLRKSVSVALAGVKLTTWAPCSHTSALAPPGLWRTTWGSWAIIPKSLVAEVIKLSASRRLALLNPNSCSRLEMIRVGAPQLARKGTFHTFLAMHEMRQVLALLPALLRLWSHCCFAVDPGACSLRSLLKKRSL
jgi:hypothetical protein